MNALRRVTLGALALWLALNLPGCEARLCRLPLEGQQALGVAGWSIVAAGAAVVVLAVEGRRLAMRQERKLVKDPFYLRGLRPGTLLTGLLLRINLRGKHL